MSEALSLEIDRVLQASYPVSLKLIISFDRKKLEHVVSECDKSIIHIWAEERSCQILSLVEVLLEALSQWPYVLNILEKLVHVLAIRDAVLQREPKILDTLLRKATMSSTHLDQYARLCVTLLSEPIDSDIPLPASAQEFFIQICERAIQTPCTTNVGLMHSLMTGACQDMLGLMPEATLRGLEDGIFKILRNVTPVDSQSLALLCFAVMAEIDRFHSRTSSAPTTPMSETLCSPQSRGASASSKLGAAPELFRGSKAPKTLQLLALRAIWACKENSTVPESEAMTDVRIASQTITAVDSAARERWSKVNEPTMQKLMQKACRTDISPGLQLQALACVGALSTKSRVPAEAASVYAKCLLTFEMDPQSDQYWNRSLQESLPIFADFLDGTFINTFLSNAIGNVLRNSHSSAKVLRKDLLLGSQLTTLLEKSSILNLRIIEALADPELLKLLGDAFGASFLEGNRSQAGLHRGLCSTAYSGMRLRLCITLSCLIVTAALNSQPGQLSPASSLAFCFLQDQACHDQNHARCVHAEHKIHRAPEFSLIEQECTPHSSLNSRDWRTRLDTELERETKRQREIIIRNVGIICRDLEERCNNVEEPLRVKDSEIEGLKKDNDELTAYAARLEVEAADQSARMEALTSERVQMVNMLRNLEDRNHEFEDQTKKLQSLLKEADANAQSLAKSIRADHDRKEMELRTLICSKEENLGRSENEVSGLKAHIQTLTEALSAQTEKSNRLDQASMNLQKALGDVEDQLQIHKDTLAEKESTLDAMTLRENGRIEELGLLQTRLQEVESDLITSKREFESSLTALQQDIDHQKRRHESELRSIEEDKSKAAAEMDRRLSQVQAELSHLQRVKEVNDEEKRLKDLEIGHLRTKIDHYMSVCDAKDEELSEAKQLKTRLMSLIGGNSEALQTQSARSAGQATVKTKTPKLVTKDMQSPECSPMGTSASFESVASSTGGRTPKRVKSKAFKPPVIRPTRSRAIAPIGTSAIVKAGPERTALADVKGGQLNQRQVQNCNQTQVDKNLSPVKRGSTRSRKKDMRPSDIADYDVRDQEERCVLENFSFEASDLLQSTPPTPEIVRAQMEETDYDDATTEFG